MTFLSKLNIINAIAMIVEVDIPNTASLTDEDKHFLKEGLVALLYYRGKLSEKEACDALGMTRRGFEDLLPQFGFSILGDDPENLKIELNA